MSEKVKVALNWLKDLLESESIEYQIVGGLAATIHGGSREIADIDLYIHNADANRILARVAPYISKPLTHYSEYGWDLEYFQLVYQNQKIEIGLAQSTKIQSSLDGSWYQLEIDFSKSVVKSYQGIELQVIPVHQLIEYKQILGREVDLIDIQQLASSSAP
ncbi:MazG-related protein [Vibrio parahaemolyticus]|uniref:nucleotidyltransferase domain-containing protein n=1 Tax=Vibrio parahaemolyticus TaxID=670 RepID=UPI001B83EBD8|nr:MazG-related protein [Vibrio parahaemolyticus]ELA7158669.1 MazG-related protein [Vibrio parahaemolyticus]ELB2920277.1 MazG-related protein [Vibrio parahaemolyticus]MDF4345451.1 MazG-related protein [Vibrio parahaemolyticus]MDF4356928.1 MazG-related protein [Vibrio parahaemolyticus]MDF4399644.1 MazG-related protein [Vibrio parahaemolyticus]